MATIIENTDGTITINPNEWFMQELPKQSTKQEQIFVVSFWGGYETTVEDTVETQETILELDWNTYLKSFDKKNGKRSIIAKTVSDTTGSLDITISEIVDIPNPISRADFALTIMREALGDVNKKAYEYVSTMNLEAQLETLRQETITAVEQSTIGLITK